MALSFFPVALLLVSCAPGIGSTPAPSCNANEGSDLCNDNMQLLQASGNIVKRHKKAGEVVKKHEENPIQERVANAEQRQGPGDVKRGNEPLNANTHLMPATAKMIDRHSTGEISQRQKENQTQAASFTKDHRGLDDIKRGDGHLSVFRQIVQSAVTHLFEAAKNMMRHNQTLEDGNRQYHNQTQGATVGDNPKPDTKPPNAEEPPKSHHHKEDKTPEHAVALKRRVTEVAGGGATEKSGGALRWRVNLLGFLTFFFSVA